MGWFGKGVKEAEVSAIVSCLLSLLLRVVRASACRAEHAKFKS